MFKHEKAPETWLLSPIQACRYSCTLHSPWFHYPSIAVCLWQWGPLQRTHCRRDDQWPVDKLQVKRIWAIRITKRLTSSTILLSDLCDGVWTRPQASSSTPLFSSTSRNASTFENKFFSRVELWNFKISYSCVMSLGHEILVHLLWLRQQEFQDILYLQLPCPGV